MNRRSIRTTNRAPSIAAFAIAATLLGVSGPVHADDTPQRNGFTVELGLGLAYTIGSTDDDMGSLRELGVAPLSLALGGFVNNDLAILGRIAGTSYFVEINGNTEQFSQSLFGVVVQYWISEELMVSGGGGLSSLGPNTFTTKLEGEDKESVGGFGAMLRVGYSIANWENHNLRAALETTPARYENATVVGFAANFEWQWF